MSSGKVSKSSPFFHRNYGGFTEPQKDFYESFTKPFDGKCILDPMGGQGFLLSQISFAPSSVWLGDLNPAPLLLASLRDPALIISRDQIKKFMDEKLNQLKVRENNEDIKSEYIDDWIASPIKKQLIDYANLFNIKELVNILQNNSPEKSDPLLRFAACLPILAARELVCYHESDNKTWLMPGGLLRETNIYSPLKQAMDEWYDHASRLANSVNTSRGKALWGTLNTSLMDVEHGSFGPSPTPDVIVTSPPYANRLDYTRMWYPEMEIASILFNLDIKHIKNEQIGSTIIRNKVINEEDLMQLPNDVQEALKNIKTDNNKASETYYYPFFCNYAVALMNSLLSMANKLHDSGILIIFIRDTVRKDILFPAGSMVENILCNQLGFTSLNEKNQDKRHIIRNHVGLLRKRNSRPSIYGIAQLEWWLAYRKG